MIQGTVTDQHIYRKIWLGAIRTAPITAEDRDLLIIAEGLSKEMLPYPALDVFQSFVLLTPAQQQHVLRATCYILKVASLQFGTDTTTLPLTDHQIMESAVQIYLMEAQRNVAYLFPEQHVFWSHFSASTRSSKTHLSEPSADTTAMIPHRADVFVLPLDILFNLNPGKHQLDYELICQAMRAVLKSKYLKDQGPREAQASLSLASQLTRRLNNPGFDAWLSQLKTQSNCP